MKTSAKSIFSLGVALALGATALCAQSCAAVDHASQSAALSVAASGEASAAAGTASVETLKTAGRIAAVPLWMSGAVANGSGTVLGSVGDSTARAGAAVMKGAESVWDPASGDPACRPALDRHVGVPPAPPPPPPAKPKDPSPAEALKSNL